MSAQDTDIILTLIMGRRRFQILIMHEPPATWFVTMSERMDNQGRTKPLDSFVTQEGPDGALRSAFDRILQAAGFTPQARRRSAVAWPARDPGTAHSPVSGEGQAKKTLRQLREEHGWAQPDVAALLGLSQGLISRWERGAAIPPEPQQARLARLFGVRVDEIAFGQAEPPSPYPRLPDASHQQPQELPP